MINRSGTNVALALKAIGVVLISSAFIDFAFLLIPFQVNNKQWQINLVERLVDAGIVPLVGLGILLAGYWINSAENDGRPQGLDLRMPAFILSTLLGLMFLVFLPIHANNVLTISSQTVEQINQDANTAEQQLNARFSQIQARLEDDKVKAQLEEEKKAFKARVTGLIKDDKRYQAALASPQVPAAEKELLKKIKANPQELDKLIAQRSNPEVGLTRQKTQIRQQKESAIKNTEEKRWKSVGTCLSSLLLCVAYSIIGWSGLRSIGVMQGGGRKTAAS
ncbi:MAG: HpsJ family protein [Cyanobacteria bacterium P01_A01_bin.45]